MILIMLQLTVLKIYDGFVTASQISCNAREFHYEQLSYVNYVRTCFDRELWDLMCARTKICIRKGFNHSF